MKNLYVNQLKKGNSLFDEEFALRKVSKSTKKDGSPYLRLEFVDRTGSIGGNMWDNIAGITPDLEDSIVSLDGCVEEFAGKLQLNVTRITPKNGADLEPFLNVTDKDTEKLWEQISEQILNVKNKHLRALLKNIFTEEMITSFKKAAGGMYVHHGYVGGLLEHTVEMLQLSQVVASQFPKINKDILITGLVLHDIGKVEEYKTGVTIQKTAAGNLLGHIALGEKIILANVPAEMPDILRDEIIHIVLSHHGEIEFGSPVMPSTIEAVIIAMLDNVSAKVNSAYQTVHNMAEGAEFSDYHKQLRTSLYRSPYLDELLNEDVPF